MKKILPTYFPPISDCYSADAGVTSVLQAFDKYNPDLFINRLYLFRKPNKVLKFATLDKKYDFSTLQYDNKDIIETIYEKIDEGKYVFIYLDHFYIENCDYYQKSHFMHDFALVYGYNSNKKSFSCADNFVNGKYSQLEISNLNILNSRSAVIHSDLFENNKNIVIFNYKKRKENLNLEKVKIILEDFLSGRCDNVKHLNNSFLKDNIFGFSHGQEVNYNECIWGIKIFEWLLEELDYVFQNGWIIDLRPFHLLANYQSILQSLVFYLCSSHLNGNENFKKLDVLQHQIDECLIIRNLVIKYNLTRNQGVYKKIKNKVKQIGILEYEILTYLIKLCKQ